MAQKSLNASKWKIPQINLSLDYHVIVIGAGIAGLTAAALLAKCGYRPLVIEQHNLVGGYCSSWKRHITHNQKHISFTFDAGVQDISGLGERSPLNNLFNKLGIKNTIEWKNVEHGYWSKNKTIHAGSNYKTYINNLSKAFPKEAASIQIFFAEIYKVYQELYADIEKTGGIPIPPTDTEDLLMWPEQHPHAAKWINQPFKSMLDSFIKDDQLKKILTTLSEYITDEPETLTVKDMVPLYGYYFNGGFYPKGGAQELSNTLAKTIKEHGGKILLKTEVENILAPQGKVTGVKTIAGDVFHVPIVLANGDIVKTLTELVPKASLSSKYTEKIRGMKRGPTALLISLGLKTVPKLPARVFIEDFGIGNPAVIDDSIASKGYAPMTILYLLPEKDAAQWIANAPNYEDKKNNAYEIIIRTIERTIWPEIRANIIFKEIATPETFKRYAGTLHGNIYGTARNEVRPHIKSPIEGLFLIGAGTQAGAGIEAVVVSGTHAANLIIQGQKFIQEV